MKKAIVLVAVVLAAGGLVWAATTDRFASPASLPCAMKDCPCGTDSVCETTNDCFSCVNNACCCKDGCSCDKSEACGKDGCACAKDACGCTDGCDCVKHGISCRKDGCSYDCCATRDCYGKAGCACRDDGTTCPCNTGHTNASNCGKDCSCENHDCCGKNGDGGCSCVKDTCCCQDGCNAGCSCGHAIAHLPDGLPRDNDATCENGSEKDNADAKNGDARKRSRCTCAADVSCCGKEDYRCTCGCQGCVTIMP